jgi:hypothetical protein
MLTEEEKKEKKIKTLISELVKKERDQEDNNNHRWASITPWKINDKREEYQKILDALARLFVGDETCAAVYVNTNENWMAVASNNHQSTHACKWMRLLSEYAKNPSKDNHFNLLENALDVACRAVNNHEEKWTFLCAEPSNFLEFKKRLFGIFSGEIKWPTTTEEWELLYGLAQVAFEEIKDRDCSIDRERYLLPFLDTCYIAKFLKSYRNDNNAFGRRKDLFELIRDNKSGGEGKNIFYWDNQANYAWRKQYMHAEMKILTMIYDYRNDKGWMDLSETEGYFNNDEEWGYIGISKLCCVPCQLVINIVNEKNPTDNVVEKINKRKKIVQLEKRFATCGTHGRTYPDWVVPNFYQEELIRKLESLFTRKICETTEEKIEYFPQILQPSK